MVPVCVSPLQMLVTLASPRPTWPASSADAHQDVLPGPVFAQGADDGHIAANAAVNRLDGNDGNRHGGSCNTAGQAKL